MTDGTKTMPISLTVNGRATTLPVAPHHTLLEVLRFDLGLTGAKECCLVGECGACTVFLDGRTVDSCLVLAVEADGADVTTAEGLARSEHPAAGGSTAVDPTAVDPGLTTLQSAFLDHGAVQCGFCIPGMVLSGAAILRSDPHPSRDAVLEGIAGNLCRCGCYEQIADAILASAAGSMPGDQ
jgi:carbon-monoxide dehydrogenase small subunit